MLLSSNLPPRKSEQMMNLTGGEILDFIGTDDMLKNWKIDRLDNDKQCHSLLISNDKTTPGAKLDRKLPFPDKHFSLVVMNEDELKKTKVQKRLKEVYRILDLKGYFLIRLKQDAELTGGEAEGKLLEGLTLLEKYVMDIGFNSCKIHFDWIKKTHSIMAFKV